MCVYMWKLEGLKVVKGKAEKQVEKKQKRRRRRRRRGGGGNEC